MTAKQGNSIVEKLLSMMKDSDMTLFGLADALRAGELCGDVTLIDCQEAIQIIRQQLMLQQLGKESIFSEELATKAGDFADILEHQLKPKTVPISPCSQLINKIVVLIQEHPELDATQFASEIHNGMGFSDPDRLLLEEVILEIRADERRLRLGENSMIPEPNLPIASKIADVIELRLKESPPPGQADDFDTSHEFYQKLAAKHNFRNSTWSIYEVTDFTLVPFPNATRLVYEPYGKLPVEIKLGRPSTWLDLWKAADKAIKECGDSEHTFIEAFEEDGETLELVTGS
jgi:hypothetical protein